MPSVYDTGRPRSRNPQRRKSAATNPCAAPLISLPRGRGGGLAFFSFILYNTVCLRTAARHRPSAFPLFHVTRPMRSIRSAAHTATGGRLCRSDKMSKTQWPLLHRQGVVCVSSLLTPRPASGADALAFPVCPCDFPASCFLPLHSILFFSYMI